MARSYKIVVGDPPSTPDPIAYSASPKDTLGLADQATTQLTSTDVGTSPTLLSRIVGLSNSPTDTIHVRVRTTSAATVRLKVGTNSAITSNVVWSSPVIPDGSGNSDHIVSGLTPGTRPYYRVAMTNDLGGEFLDTHAVVGQSRLAPTGVASFNIDAASCSDSINTSTMAVIGARDDDLFFHLGDLMSAGTGTYADGTGTSRANILSKMTTQISGSNFQTVLATRPCIYIPSDHDGMSNNSTAGSDPTAWTNWNSVHREIWPTPTLPGGTTGVYYTFSWGRIRFIATDTRSFATISSATDNSSKTRYGATQKQWIKDTITNATEPKIVIANSDPWIGAAQAGDDAWMGYTTERTEMANFYAASNKQIEMIIGDMHALAAEDGSSSPGGVAVFHNSPLENSASQKGGPYDVGPYPASGTSVVKQYGRLALNDDGTTMTTVWTGYDSTNVQRLTLTTTVNAPSTTAAPTMTVGDLPASTIAPSGWNQVLAEDWNTSCTLGNWPATYPNWLAYPDASGWDNNHTTFYYGGKGIKVEGGILKTRCFYEASTGKFRTDTIRPPIGQGRSQLYGVYEIAYRLPAALPGYKQAWLLWPADNIGSHGEIDFPESSFDAGSVIKGFVHRADGVVGNATSYTSTTVVTDGEWHVTRIVWSPDRVQFYLDGALVKDYSSTTLVLSQEGTWRIQTEGNLSGTTPLITPGAPDNTGISQSTDGYVEIAYCCVWTRN